MYIYTCKTNMRMDCRVHKTSLHDSDKAHFTKRKQKAHCDTAYLILINGGRRGLYEDQLRALTFSIHSIVCRSVISAAASLLKCSAFDSRAGQKRLNIISFPLMLFSPDIKQVLWELLLWMTTSGRSVVGLGWTSVRLNNLPLSPIVGNNTSLLL